MPQWSSATASEPLPRLLNRLGTGDQSRSGAVVGLIRRRGWPDTGRATLRADQVPEVGWDRVTDSVMAYRRGNDMILLGCVGVSAGGQ
jgi:hypothetical protein